MTWCKVQLLCKVYDDPEHGLGAYTCPGSSTLENSDFCHAFEP